MAQKHPESRIHVTKALVGMCPGQLERSANLEHQGMTVVLVCKAAEHFAKTQQRNIIARKECAHGIVPTRPHDHTQITPPVILAIAGSTWSDPTFLHAGK